MNHIVKRAGHSETFDDRKLYASIYSSCLAVRMTDAESESIAERVTAHVAHSISKRVTVRSHEIRKTAAEILHQYNPDAAYIYTHHRDIA